MNRSHVITFIVYPNATFFFDNIHVRVLSLYDAWHLAPIKQMKDTIVKDWEELEDLEVLRIPKDIPDPNAKKPEEWDVEEDGEWIVPTIRNPKYKIRRQTYEGKVNALTIDFNSYLEDLYIFPNLKYIIIEFGLRKSRTLFENILTCDDHEYALKIAAETWGKHNDALKATLADVEKKKKDEEGYDKENEDYAYNFV
ncbi:hypothetical protein GIB67_037332 [Kingdonia uniflora]|nr:hypothetical protein GIB67_037332 [Kingdonia uniflora]